MREELSEEVIGADEHVVRVNESAELALRGSLRLELHGDEVVVVFKGKSSHDSDAIHVDAVSKSQNEPQDIIVVVSGGLARQSVEESSQSVVQGGSGIKVLFVFLELHDSAGDWVENLLIEGGVERRELFQRVTMASSGVLVQKKLILSHESIPVFFWEKWLLVDFIIEFSLLFIKFC